MPLKRANGIVANLLLMTGSAVAALYVLEIALSVTEGGGPARGQRTPVVDPRRDPRDRMQVTEDLRANGVEAYPSLVPRMWVPSDGLDNGARRLFPLSSRANSVTVFCRRRADGQYTVYESDGQGFNNPPGTWQDSAPEVVLIGDSFAQGHCVRPGRDVGGLLRGLGVRVVNLGMSVSGPLIELGILSEYAKGLKPVTVFWLYFEANDLRNLVFERSSAVLRGYLTGDVDQRLLERREEIDLALEFYVARLHTERRAGAPATLPARGSSVIPTLKLWRVRSRLGLTRRGPGFPLGTLGQFHEILARAQSVTESWGGRLVLVYLPDRRRYFQGPADDDLYGRASVLEVVARQGISVVDVHKVFSRESDYERLFAAPEVDTHYSEYGYAVVARALHAHLGSRHD